MVLINTGGLDPKDEKAIEPDQAGQPEAADPNPLLTRYDEGRRQDNARDVLRQEDQSRSHAINFPAQMSLLILGNHAGDFGTILSAPESTW